MIPGNPVAGRNHLGLLLALAVGMATCAQQPERLENFNRPATLQSGFQEEIAWSGLTRPTAVRFAPDGRVFVAEKRGRIVVYDGLSDTTPTPVVDFRDNVHDFWDRGFLGLAIHPQFPAQPFIYVLYTLDAPAGGTPPVWGDGCPNPPGATADGCVVGARLSRYALDGAGVATGGETILIESWGQQYPSHSIGDLAFGPDGALYVTGGDGASFNFVDYGQDGSPLNPLADPPVLAGEVQTPPTARGGALRSQSLRRPSGEPVLLNGTLLRLDPETGAGLPGNPLAAHADANAQRIVAQGLRNPFRLTVRPGSNELWVGDVGWGAWEEIERVADPTLRVANFGWPCYEGNARQGGYDSANLALCEALYAEAGAVDAPYYAYNHGAKVVAGESCPTGGSAISGLAFAAGSEYPAKYQGALFFADYSRNCAWVMLAGANGLPDPTQIETFIAGAATPVDLQMGPDGNLYYVDINGGTVRRIRYLAPTAVAQASPHNGVAPLAVNFSGTASTGALAGDTLSYAWDLDGDGAFDDAAEHSPAFLYTTVGSRSVRLRVTDQRGTSNTSSPLTITVTDVPVPVGQAPVPVIDTPAAAFTWTVGDTITFSGHATDAEDGVLPAAALSWMAVLQHCPDGCHAHVMQTWDGTAGASCPAPDHEYPAHVELILTATDSSGARASTSVRLDPKTSWLTLQSVPPGLRVAVAGDAATAPFGRLQTRGGVTTIAAPSPQTLAGATWAFSSWSDGGGLIHQVGPLLTDEVRTALYRPAGLLGQYFSDRTLGTAVLSRVDATVNFDWGDGTPAAGVGVNNFSVRWRGFVESAVSETFTFMTDSDDGVRVWVADTLIIDNWTDHGVARNDSAPIALTAGVKVPLRMEFYEATGGSVARLLWKSSSVPEQVVPAASLHPACLAGLCPAGLACLDGACVTECAGVSCPAGQRCEAGGCVDACGGLTCTGGKCLGGQCVDLCTGTVCPDGQKCTAGTCVDVCDGITCPAGQKCAAGSCVDACQGVTCPGGQACQAGACVDLCMGVMCPLGQSCSNGACVDTCLSLTCPMGEICKLGACVDACTDVICPSGQKCTAGDCVDVCTGVSCPSGEKCVAGACVDACQGVNCPEGEKCAAGACVDVCQDVTCPGGQKCLGGACVSLCTGITCPNGTVCDAGTCVDPCSLLTCGPGTICQAGQCVDGCLNVSCPRGFVCQGGDCVDQCQGISCPLGFRCAEGVCLDPCAGVNCTGDDVCSGGTCVDPCAGINCPGGQVCRSGQCVDPCGGVNCPVGQKCSAGACVDACDGVTCATGEKCDAGACVPLCTGVSCTEGMICRAGACVGICDGVICPGGQVCQAGNCIDACQLVTCPSGQNCVAGNCVDPCQSVTCGNGSICVAGACVDACQGVSCDSGQVCQAGTCVNACQGVTCGVGQHCELGSCVADSGGSGGVSGAGGMGGGDGGSGGGGAAGAGGGSAMGGSGGAGGGEGGSPATGGSPNMGGTGGTGGVSSGEGGSSATGGNASPDGGVGGVGGAAGTGMADPAAGGSSAGGGGNGAVDAGLPPVGGSAGAGGAVASDAAAPDPEGGAFVGGGADWSCRIGSSDRSPTALAWLVLLLPLARRRRR